MISTLRITNTNSQQNKQKGNPPYKKETQTFYTHQVSCSSEVIQFGLLAVMWPRKNFEATVVRNNFV
jgi:hypothetical protein